VICKHNQRDSPQLMQAAHIRPTVHAGPHAEGQSDRLTSSGAFEQAPTDGAVPEKSTGARAGPNSRVTYCIPDRCLFRVASEQGKKTSEMVLCDSGALHVWSPCLSAFPALQSEQGKGKGSGPRAHRRLG